jgi:hypothetical protein
MIVLMAGLVGAISGFLTARSRGGNRLDMAQYAAVFGIAFALLGVVVTVIIGRAI